MESRIPILRFPNLTGKIVLIYIKNRSLEDFVVLKRVSFEIQGDKTFIVGEFAEGTTANDWAAGVPTAIAWDSVEQYLIFNSLDDYFSRETQSYDIQNLQ